MNKVNEDFLKVKTNNEKNGNYNIFDFEFQDSDNEEDEKNIEESKNINKNESDIINSKNYVNNNNIIPLEEFEKFKKGILLYIENNTQNKYKKKLLNLMKLNKIDNKFLTLKK